LVLVLALTTLATSARATGEPAGCDENDRGACLYAPPTSYAIGQVDRILTDPARNNHVVPIRIRYPIGASGPRPVILWNHGGSTRQERPGGGYNFSSPEHSALFTAAGYVTVLIDRTPARAKPTPDQLKVCMANEASTPAACQNWYGFHVHGPRNTPFVVSYLATVAPAELPGFTGTLDLARVVVGGFSGGTELVLNHAGAPQHWPLLQQASVHVAGVAAFVAAAPRGPDYAGFSAGFDDIAYRSIGEAPFLFLLARNEHPGEQGSHGGPARSGSWLNSHAGGKLMSWDTNDAVTHVNLDLSRCNESAVQADHCAWTGAATLAFLDAYVQHVQEAIDWLGSDAHRILTGGSIELHRR
jgi:hypothetical protein